MAKNTASRALLIVTAYLLLVTRGAAQKVYFGCGAVVDVVETQGLILSPGFPYNYSSGSHCVWQFFVPVGYQLVMEMFDFDVFESPSWGRSVDEDASDPAVPDRGDPIQGDMPVDEGLPQTAQNRTDMHGHDHLQEDGTPVVAQEQSSLSAPLAHPGTQRAGYRGDGNPDPEERHTKPRTPPTPMSIWGAGELSTGPQLPAMDSCPHDVLYISDLITFSSRFCGSNNPTGRRLVFGSPKEMVEVIVELITTTHWGRGFALLFRYQNRSDASDQRLPTPPAGQKETLLAATGGTAFFVLVLTSALCVIFRPKLCRKAAADSFSSNNLEDGGRPGRELQLVGPQDTDVTVTADGASADVPPRPPHTASGSISGGPDISHNPELELSSDGLMELDLGTDERDRSLRHSDSALPAQPDGGSRMRPRAWSVRTFQDLLRPLSQHQCEWSGCGPSSPFTKLVDTTSASSGCHGSKARKVFSDGHLEGGDSCNHDQSSGSTASYPLALPAQRQRRLNSGSNLRRSLFTAPCFGLFSGLSEGGPFAPRPPPPEPVARDPGAEPQASMGVPVFAISEEEDRQPLVQAEHLNGQHREPNGQASGPVRGRVCGEGSLLGPDSPAASRKTKPNFTHAGNKQLQPLSLSPSAVTCNAVGKEM
ncbi:uncharacterized protein si:dkey-112e17.1 isoform X2 [Brienomyrus brachyistius]|uniref:uncharacterized protein si:dkey-112e17.1 isoform X2 n=1 Tax=Brienomyrus brachyistius TaxID=42636 RepID=UPI0020B3FC55|nr:uncharacterized protein si:dkey-112e17.1 isoform X2 [Brienomyrus brachyistius]